MFDARCIDALAIIGLPTTNPVSLDESGAVVSAYHPTVTSVWPSDAKLPALLPLMALPDGVLVRRRIDLTLSEDTREARVHPLVIPKDTTTRLGTLTTEGKFTTSDTTIPLPSSSSSPVSSFSTLSSSTPCHIYASCLSFWDGVPDHLVLSDDRLLGLHARCCLVALSTFPIFTTMESLLHALYEGALFTGLPNPFPSLIPSVLTSLRFPKDYKTIAIAKLAGVDITVRAPPSSCPSAGDLSLQPLVLALPPRALLQLYLAALLEQRILFRSSSFTMLVIAAQGELKSVPPPFALSVASARS